MYLHPCLFSSLFLFFFFLIFPLSLCDDQFEECEKMFECGNFKTGYPFWGKGRHQYCGHQDLELHCDKDDTPTIEINSQKFRLLEIHNETLIMNMFPIEFLKEECPQNYVKTTLDSPLFQFNTDVVNMTLFYGCPSSGWPNPDFHLFICSMKDILHNTSYFGPSEKCKTIDPSTAIRNGIEVKWKLDDQKCMDCIGGGGRCGFDKGVATCFCPQTKPECSNKSTGYVVHYPEPEFVPEQ